MPWDDEADYWFEQMEYNLRSIGRAAPEPVDAAKLMRRLREEVRTDRYRNGLMPFDRNRCIAYWTRDSERRLADELSYGNDRMQAARHCLGVDWCVWNDGTADGPSVPAPWLGCLLEARMRVMPEYRGLWLDLMDRLPGWRFEPLPDDKDHPMMVKLEHGGELPVQCMVPAKTGDRRRLQ